MTPIALALVLEVAQPTAKPPQVTPTVAGVGLEATRDAVVAILGKPQSENSEKYDDGLYAYGDMVVMTYPGLHIRLVNGVERRGPFRVLEIDATDPKWAAGPSLRVGMKSKDAAARFPSLELLDDPNRPGKKSLSYPFDVPNTTGGRLTLDLESGKVSRIVLTSDLD